MDTIKWEQWGDEAFGRARETDRAVFLWIIYRGCRACEQMEAESFGDPKVVETIHAQYVPVRIDRDERPDIDRHFQRVFTTMLGKEEGWPLTMFLTPDLTPLYAAAYVPHETRDGMMGLGAMLELVARKYAEDRVTLVGKGEEVLAQLALPASLTATHLDEAALGKTFVRQFDDVYDDAYGGLGEAPKYLRIPALEAALSWGARTEDSPLLERIAKTLDTVLGSEVWDEEAGGVYCCTLDETWQIPSRRKNLGENARMMVLLLRAGKIFGHARYVEAAERIADWALTHMQDRQTQLFCHGTLDQQIDTRYVLASNAMMVDALCQLAQHKDRYRPDALGAIHAVMESYPNGDNLIHQFGEETGAAFFEDYVWLARALLSGYDLSGNPEFFQSAEGMIQVAIRRFFQHGFWSVGDGDFRDPVPFADGPFSSAVGEMVSLLYRLSEAVDNGYRPFADRTLSVASFALMPQPISHAKMAESLWRIPK